MRTAMDILLVTPELQYTGAVQSFRRICLVLKNNGYGVEVWSYRQGPFVEEFNKIGIHPRIVDEESIDEAFMLKEASRFNLLIANTVVTYRAADVAQSLMPVIWYIREAQNLPEYFWKPGREDALRRAKKLYCVSEYAREFIVENYNPNVEVVHNYVDDVFESSCFFLDEKKHDAVRFLALGTIEKRKGFDVLVDAFIELPIDVREKCELHFAGRLWEGAKNFYPKILEDIKPFENIIYHGELRDRDDIHNLIAQSDVVVVPSRDESCSLTALEGAMMGRPLILSENIGAKYIVSDRSGWIVETGSKTSLGNAFIEAVANANSLSDYGREARRRYLKTSTYDIYEHAIIEMVEDAIAETSYQYRANQKCYELYSFDIFDTLLTRSTAQPKGIFLLMQEKLDSVHFASDMPESIRKNFAEIRMSAERFMYREVCKGEKQDVTLAEVYDLIASDHGLTIDQANSLMKLEVEEEARNLLPLQTNIELVRKMISEGHRVILITDMYFQEKDIRSFLVAADPLFDNVPIYVSSNYQKKKNNGELYRTVREIEQIPYDRWLHCGDNWEIDCIQAMRLGIDAHICRSPSIEPYEARALKKLGSSPEIQLKIGASRYERFAQNLSDIGKLGLSFGGPILYPYVCWVLENAERKNVSDLYFIARDGFILKHIAEVIIKNSNLHIQTHYLYGSREAWRNPVENRELEKMKLASEYLSQTIDHDSRYAFVEFAGTGRTQDCLMELIGEENGRSCIGCFYFYHSADPFKQSSKKYSMLRLNERFSNCYELLVRAPHGQTLDYSRDLSGNVVPNFEQSEGEALKAYGYEDYVRGVKLHTEVHLGRAASTIFASQDFTLLLEYCDYLTSNDIDAITLDLLGGIPFTLDGKTRHATCYSPRLSEEQALQYTSTGKLPQYWGPRLLWSKRRSIGKAAEILTRENVTQDRIEMQAAQIEQLKKAKQDAERKAAKIKESNSFRLGRVVTYLPRKARKAIRDIQKKTRG